ncbi:phosphotransferase [Nitrosomonas nitrosa]|uniref:phosphotransferase n=1 Tax=Nitrosomonas nitrosa TaxID=52442 RepID=UPI0023F96ADF|nr:phosphotransferase [Nitrosomonas nitrosa]MCO6432802.1 aminoglycoside phosphotransferase family protein [Nitrosomonas nitrosa]
MLNIENKKLQNTLPNIPLLQGDVVDLTDGDSNRVVAIDQRYIYKQYFSQKQLRQETAGYLLFNSLTSFGVPMVLDKGNDYLILEFIDAKACFALHHRQRILSKNQIAQKAALFIAEVYWNYRFFDKNRTRLFIGVAWDERTADILAKSIRYADQVAKIIQADKLPLIRAAQEVVAAVDTDERSLTLLHRDLHLDNILVKNDCVGRNSNYVIDFEHCMEGPIELEMQNSIFWNDDWSIPIEAVRDELTKKHDVPYSLSRERDMLSVYFLDQLNLAMEKNDEEKAQVLVNLYDQRIQERD